MSLLNDVTETQKEAITHFTGPLLVIAGAGSGKTRVITRRIGYLMEQGINPYNILALTFTNKAAKEMKERVEQFCEHRGLWISTFHSMCTRILRCDIEKIGYAKTFTIYDKQDQVNSIKEVMKELEIDTTTWQPRKIGNTISNAKNNLLTAEQYAGNSPGYYEKQVSQVYSKYETVLKNNNALDFDDLLMKVVELFRTHTDVLEKYQEKFKFILIDEYQDTNHTQYTIARLLSDCHKNICVTGDPDQSIYSWRGADMRNILDFEDDFPNAKTVKLEQNYRSTKKILRAASEIISNNLMRKAKELWTKNADGNKIKVIYSKDENHEAETIAKHIKSLVQNKEITFSDIAIFYRTNAQSRVIETALHNNSIPYTMVGALEFYSRKEIKDILAYLKLCINPSDNIALSRIINIPPRGIGKISLEKIRKSAHISGISMLRLLFELTGSTFFENEKQPVASNLQEIADTNVLKGKSNIAINKFVEIMTNLRSMVNAPVKEIVKKVVEVTNYVKYLEDSDETTNVDRVENIQELISASNEYDINNPEGSLSDFLENVALVADLDNWDNQANATALMTLHSAKGLEFPVVFLTGMEEDLLPHGQSKDTDFGLEEERRLCYVGITRAKRELILTHAQSRFRYGERKFSISSRFLDEIPDDIIELIDNTQYKPDDNVYCKTKKYNEIDKFDEFDKNNDFNIKTGDSVRHSSFGKGRVLNISGNGKGAKAQIEFNMAGTKMLVLEYAKLEKL